MRRLLTFPLIALAVLGVPSCGDDEPVETGPGASARELDGRTFLSSRVTEGGVERALVPGTRITLAFEAGAVRATAGCNIMTGGYEVTGGVLLIDGLAMTEMGCDQALHDQDGFVAALLTSRPQMELSGMDLIMRSGDVEVAFEDRVVADPDRPLVGTTWQVETLVDGETASTLPAGFDATVRIEEGRLHYQGCNTGGGPVSEVDGRLEVGLLAVTRMSCGADVDGAERAVLEVLEQSPNFEITGPVLRLDAGDRGLVLRAVE